VRFEQFLHWNSGLFLQPQHFQYLQRTIAEYNRLNRAFSLPYPYGLLDFELDGEALKGRRIVVKRFSAIMSDGLELSAPGNCVLQPLDLQTALKNYPEDLTIYLAVPHYSELEGNLADEKNPSAKMRYIARERQVRDENFGDNEIALVTRKINVRLLTSLDEAADMDRLPILKLKITTRDAQEISVTVNEKYIPPYMLLSSDSGLFSMVYNLLVDLRHCRDKVLNSLTTVKFRPEDCAGVDGHNLLMLRALGLYENRLTQLLAPGRTSPFGLYLELTSLLAELMGINPMNGVREIQPYNHEDCAPQFAAVTNDIRSFISAEGGVTYTRINFAPTEDGAYLSARLSMDITLKAHEVYLAVKCEAEERTVIKALETGDTFKLINPSARTVRIRGIRLEEVRYPPRFLPVLNNTLWFRFQLAESSRVWYEMCQEQGALIDWARDLFPSLEAALFITTQEGA